MDLSPVFLVGLGFGVGLLGGFFGVGGSFLAGPALFSAGLPMHFVVGTDLAHIAGKSVVAARKHWSLGNVDVKLGCLMTAGTVLGVELGAQAVEHFKGQAEVERMVSAGLLTLMLGTALFMLWEGSSSLRQRSQGDPVSSLARRLQRIRLGPRVTLPVSGLRDVSVLVIVAVSFFGGICSGFLGGGAGYIRMPMLVYLLGVPTHVAIGTDLFEIIISAGYGTFSHALKGNVDVMIALMMALGASAGARIGATCTQYVSAVWLRLLFVPLPLLGAALVIRKLWQH